MDDITIHRVENGWIIRQSGEVDRFAIGLRTHKVAGTPDQLLKIVGDWAKAQPKKS